MHWFVCVLLTTVSVVPDWTLEQETMEAPEGSASWMNVLRFPLLNTSIALTPTRKSDAGFWPGWADIQRDSVKVTWLREPETLWVAWTIEPTGQGAYTPQCHAIVAIRPATRVLWQGAYLVNWRAGGDRGTKVVAIEHAAERDTYYIQVIQERILHLSEKQPLAILDNGGPWRQETLLLERQALQLCGGSLVPGASELWLDLENRHVTGREVAEYAVLLLAPRWGAMAGTGVAAPGEVEAMLRELKLCEAAEATGRVRLPHSSDVVRAIAPGDDYYPWHGCEE